MKPIDQDKFGEKDGNCLQASIASVLELPLDTVPNFCADHGNEWLANLNDWLVPSGLVAIVLDCKKTDRALINELTFWCVCEASVRSPRMHWLEHSVLVHHGKVIHDPHPSKASLGATVDDLISITAFVAMDPALARDGASK